MARLKCKSCGTLFDERYLCDDCRCPVCGMQDNYEVESEINAYRIYFGNEDTHCEVQYKDQILIDALIDEVEYMRQYYPNGRLWLKRND